MTFPRVSDWPHFVCELCTVRANVRRDLHHPGDPWLLRLERMRLLDMVHYWGMDTTRNYQGKIKTVRTFESQHPGLSVLDTAPLLSPPVGPDVTAAWVELDQSVRKLAARGRLEERTPVFGTIRQIRSAISQFHTWDMLVRNPGGTYLDTSRRLLVGDCRPTDSAAYTLFSRGLSARIGDQPIPATALLGRHALGIDRWLESGYQRARGPVAAAQWARAGLAHTSLWLGWLRSGETFGLHGQDATPLYPNEWAIHDLPEDTGAVLLRLGAETKSNRVANADVVMAYTAGSGLSPGRWLERLYQHDEVPADVPIFRDPRGRPWDSYYYRHRYLYPALWHLRSEGDAFLATLDRKALQDKYWSLHCYRRGARTECQRAKRGPGLRKASKAQVYEHARWMMKRSSEEIDVLYREWTLHDRLCLTLHSL